MFDSIKEWLDEMLDLFRSEEADNDRNLQMKAERYEKRRAFTQRIKLCLNEHTALVGVVGFLLIVLLFIGGVSACINAEKKETEELINSALAAAAEEEQQTAPSNSSASYESWSDCVSSTLSSCSTDEVYVDKNGVLQVCVSDISNTEDFIVTSGIIALYTGAFQVENAELPRVEGCTITIYENDKIVGALVFAPSFSDPPIFSSTILVSPECSQSDELWDCYFKNLGANDVGYSKH